MTQILEGPRHAAPEQIGAGGVKVGDVFYRSWGYDQTNINYYIVTALTKSGKSAKIAEIGKIVERDNGPQVYVLPDVERLLEENPLWCVNCHKRIVNSRGGGQVQHLQTDSPQCVDDAGFYIDDQFAKTAGVKYETKRIQSSGSHVYLSYNSYSSLSKWNGEALYETGAGWGH